MNPLDLVIVRNICAA